MTESGIFSDRIRCGGAALVGLFILIATIAAFAPSYAAEPITSKVEAIRGLPGLPLPHYRGFLLRTWLRSGSPTGVLRRQQGMHPHLIASSGQSG